MDEHDVAAQLSAAGALDLLEHGSLLRLAYDGLDATPRVIPIGFLWTGTALVVCTVVESPKVRAIQAHPQVAVTIDDGASPANARSLLVRGPATVEIVEGVPSEYLDAAKKTMDPEMHAGFEEQVTQLYERMARISITPTWARFYDFGAGRLPGFLQDLIDQQQG